MSSSMSPPWHRRPDPGDYTQAARPWWNSRSAPGTARHPRARRAVSVPRDAFVADVHRALSYADLQLPLGHGEVMMKPVVEGRMLQALEIAPGDSVLEIGSGSGFISACLGRLAREVLSLELHADLADSARARLATLGLDGNVRIETTDALAWNPDGDARFDAICITGAVADLAHASRFMQWLQPGGRLFVVRGHAPAMEAVLLHDEATGVRVQSLFETDLPYLAGAAPVPQFRL